MLFIKNCPICIEGLVGFLLCSDNEAIIPTCDECDTVWLSPHQIDAEHALYPSPPNFLVPTLDCSIISPPARWATRGDIEKKGWNAYVAGEGKALDED